MTTLDESNKMRSCNLHASMTTDYKWALISVEVFLALNRPRRSDEERLAINLQMYEMVTSIPAYHDCCGGRVPDL
jgi:hypothetical protein